MVETQVTAPASDATKDAGATRAPALATRGLSKSFGSLTVARDIELELPVGGRYALIGPNGAGKTTLINLVTGMLAPNAGQILLGGEDITALEPQQRVRRGLARTFQINTLFPGLNALEAVTLVVAERRGVASEFWRNIGMYREAVEEAHDILVKLKLGDACYQPTRELPYGRQRLLEIALALATKPKVLLLDEPFEGLAPVIVDELTAAIKAMLADRRIAIVLVEQHTDFALELSASAIVLERGAVAHRAPATELQKDPATLERLVGLRVSAGEVTAIAYGR